VAVAAASFDIAHGETVGLMGESGCGKSTIALALLGLLGRETAEISGSIKFRNQDLVGMPECELQTIRGAAISLVSQEPEISLSPVMRVGEQIAEVFRAHRHLSAQKCRAEAESMLALVDLPQTQRIFSAYPHQLSGGQQQRVVLAQALACRPPLVIADEPTASLDALSQSAFIALLRDLKQQLQISLLLISHTPEIQASLADRVLVMKEGQILEQGTFAQLFRKPTYAYTRSLVRANRGADLDDSHDWHAALHATEEFVR
jgi:ABC-type glutathione transport system ATPase component